VLVVVLTFLYSFGYSVLVESVKAVLPQVLIDNNKYHYKGITIMSKFTLLVVCGFVYVLPVHLQSQPSLEGSTVFGSEKCQVIFHKFRSKIS